MPIVNKRAALTPANGRASDVAQRLTESIAPIQQQRTVAAFRVQGIQCILYNRLTQGRQCVCCTKPATATKLSPDGKADLGSINRIITGADNFGVTTYNPQREQGNQWQGRTSTSADPWKGDLVSIGSLDDQDVNLVQDGPGLGDTGQFSPDFDNLFKDLDTSLLGLTDVSCPICFGSTFIGGYSVFRGFRTVLVPQDFKTSAFIDPKTWEMSAGAHTARIVLPKGANGLDAFRVMRGRNSVPFNLLIDGQSAAGRHLLPYFDGREHSLTIEVEEAMTHLEIQGSLSTESTYFEFPRRPKNGDIALLEKTDPFQLLLSPDVPQLDTLDVIVESQKGKALVVGSTNPWETHRRNPLGWECQVRVAQPQELFNILPVRNPKIGMAPARPTAPTKTEVSSGVGIKSFTF